MTEPTQMRKFRLEEIIPQPSEFTLKETGLTYHLRPYTLADAAWAEARYGEGRIVRLFRGNVDPSMLYELAFHLMVDKDQDRFLPQDCFFRDAETGEKTPGKIGGARLLAHFIKGPAEVGAVLTAVRETMGLSQSILDEFKKKAEAAYAGLEPSSLPSTSGDSPQAKSAG